MINYFRRLIDANDPASIKRFTILIALGLYTITNIVALAINKAFINEALLTLFVEYNFYIICVGVLGVAIDKVFDVLLEKAKAKAAADVLTHPTEPGEGEEEDPCPEEPLGATRKNLIQAILPKRQQILGVKKDKQLTKNFNIKEFACKDGTDVPDKYEGNVTVLAQNLQVLRDYLKESITVNSGYRTASYNKRVGGKPASKHLVAQAGDLTVRTKSPRELAAIIEKLIAEKKMRQGGIGIYPGFVHYDVRGTKARW